MMAVSVGPGGWLRSQAQAKQWFINSQSKATISTSDTSGRLTHN